MIRRMVECEPVFKAVSGRNLMEFVMDNDKIVNFEFEMLINNNIPGILQTEAVKVDGQVKLSFSISSLIPFDKFLERREISRDEFLLILKQIITLIDVLDDYMLDGAGLVFDSRFIYIDPQKLELGFVYLPVCEKGDGMDSLKAYLLNVIVQEMRFKNEPSDNFLQRLIEILKTKELRTRMLKEYIKDMEAPARMPVDFVSKVSHGRTAPAPDSLPPVKQETMTIQKSGFPSKSYVVLISVVSAFIFFGVVLCFTGTFNPANPDFLLSLFAYLMIGGALSYLVYSKLFTPEKMVEKTVDIKADKKVPVPQNPPVAANKPAAAPGISTVISPISPVMVSQKKMEYVNKAFSMPKQDHTVILDAGSLKCPSLKGVSGVSMNTIMLTTFPFMIGRMEDQVDYCLKNPAIGKIHAEIKKKENGYFIADMNSRNGTLLDGERLEPNRDYLLRNGARITFANEEYIFNEGSGKKAEKAI